MAIQQITIVGVGLIGGSLALGLKKRGFSGRIVGCDRALVLARTKRMGVIDLGIEDPLQATHGSDVVVLATPVGAILDLIERLGPMLPPETLLTDVGSTKSEIVARAQAVFGQESARRFLAGHPMAGKEQGGVEQADPELFQGAVWLFTPAAGQKFAGMDQGRGDEWREWVSRLGARILEIDAVRHDRLCAWVSHLPQMLATALAASLEDEFGDDAELQSIGGRALREMTRIAGSPYSMWRDIALTNTGNIEDALLRLEQRLAHLRENLRTRGLEEEFETAHKFRKQ
ncbi:MAG: prephenate dehydrogenase [Candidatus Korobacteraceae bacterium]